jgi:hypothetical protein
MERFMDTIEFKLRGLRDDLVRYSDVVSTFVPARDVASRIDQILTAEPHRPVDDAPPLRVDEVIAKLDEDVLMSIVMKLTGGEARPRAVREQIEARKKRTS